MATVTFDITMSLDGFVAGPDANAEQPLGAGGEELHEWAISSRDWREPHGLAGGEVNADSGANVAQQALQAGWPTRCRSTSLRSCSGAASVSSTTSGRALASSSCGRSRHQR